MRGWHREGYYGLSPGFNPRPALRPGDAPMAKSMRLRQTRFNPRPALRPGDAWPLGAACQAQHVSIRARP